VHGPAGARGSGRREEEARAEASRRLRMQGRPGLWVQGPAELAAVAGGRRRRRQRQSKRGGGAAEVEGDGEVGRMDKEERRKKEKGERKKGEEKKEKKEKGKRRKGEKKNIKKSI